MPVYDIGAPARMESPNIAKTRSIAVGASVGIEGSLIDPKEIESLSPPSGAGPQQQSPGRQTDQLQQEVGQQTALPHKLKPTSAALQRLHDVNNLLKGRPRRLPANQKSTR